MIKNFEEIKQQLKELSEVINSFKSEAVQLRIVELVFGLVADEEGEQANDNKPPAKTTRKKAKKTSKEKAAKKTAPSKTTKRSSGEGASATLTKLIEQGFFSKPKTISDIIEHCSHNLARKFQSNEFSGKLARLVRDGTLKRSKNDDNQYEYSNP